MSVLLLLGLAALALTIFSACASEDSVTTSDTGNSGNTEIPIVSENVLPEAPPGIRGVITKSDTTVGSLYIMVEENPADSSGSPKASVRFNNETKIYRGSASDLERIGYSALTTGRKVSVWFAGPVAESYPVQGYASVILLED